MVNIRPFSPVFPSAGVMAEALYWLSLWNFKKESTISYNPAFQKHCRPVEYTATRCPKGKTANRDSINTKGFEGREEGARGRGERNFLQKVSLSPDIPFPYFASSTRTGVSFSAGILTVGSRCSWLVSALAGLSAKWKGRKTVPGWRSVAVRRRATMEP